MDVSSHSPALPADGSFKHFMILWIRQTIQFNLIKWVFSALSHEMLPPLLHAPLALLSLLVLLLLDVPFLCNWLSVSPVGMWVPPGEEWRLLQLFTPGLSTEDGPEFLKHLLRNDWVFELELMLSWCKGQNAFFFFFLVQLTNVINLP